MNHHQTTSKLQQNMKEHQKINLWEHVAHQKYQKTETPVGVKP